MKTSDCMDFDLAFSTNTTHSWGIHSNEIKKTQTWQRQYQEKRKKCSTFFTIVSAITVQEAEDYKNSNMPNINKNKEEDREMKKSLMKKLRQS